MNKLIQYCVMVAVGILVFSALLVPVVNTGASEKTTISNLGANFKLTDDSADVHTIVISADADGLIITTDGELCKLPDFSLFGSATIVFCEDSFIRLGSNGLVEIYGATNASTYGKQKVGTASAGNPITITITGNSAAVSTYTIPNVSAYIADSGDYVLANHPYVKNDSIVYIGASNIIDGANFAFVLYGNINDLIGKGVWPNGRSIGDVTVSLDNPVTNLYKVDKIEAVALVDGVERGTMTITYFLAPKVIEYDNPSYAGDNLASILGVIPLIVIVGLIAGIVGVIAVRRNA